VGVGEEREAVSEALCVGQAAAFELAGKSPRQIRAAVELCRQCPMLVECGRGAPGTVDMIRAGRVYTSDGVAYHPEWFIRRQQRIAAGRAEMLRAFNLSRPCGDRGRVMPWVRT
jgi:hypothetical protein